MRRSAPATTASIGDLLRRCFVSGGGCARAGDGQSLVGIETLLAIQAFEESASCFADHDGNGGTFHGDCAFCRAVRTILIFETDGIRVQSCLRDLVLNRTPGAEMFGRPFHSIQFIWFLFQRRTPIPCSETRCRSAALRTSRAEGCGATFRGGRQCKQQVPRRPKDGLARDDDESAKAEARCRTEEPAGRRRYERRRQKSREDLSLGRREQTGSTEPRCGTASGKVKIHDLPEAAIQGWAVNLRYG
jgi:hypothetical protein